MSEKGISGPPVDSLDQTCKQWKDCMKCAKIKYGKFCIGEFRWYQYGFSGADVVCLDKGNSCDRDICECDKRFAENIAKTESLCSAFRRRSELKAIENF